MFTNNLNSVKTRLVHKKTDTFNVIRTAEQLNYNIIYEQHSISQKSRTHKSVINIVISNNSNLSSTLFYSSLCSVYHVYIGIKTKPS